MMRLLGVALGEDRILGEKFPQERQREEFAKRGAVETCEQHEYRLYAQRLLEPNDAELLAKAKDMNPNGFWECPFTVRGVRFQVSMEKKLRDLEAETERQTICKIVSQGLAQSDPRYISKIIFMVRHPRAVAKSQERLRREMKFRTEDGVEHDLYDGATVHSPKMFIDVTVAALRWIEEHFDIPILLVRYDDLIGDAVHTLSRVGAFLDEGDAADWALASMEIDPDLRRSYPQEQKSNLWNDAESVYRMLESLDFEGARKFRSNQRSMTSRETRSWMCLRCEQEVVEVHCLRCKKNHEGFRTNLREYADEHHIPWKDRPCAFEVAHDLDNSLVDIEISIDDNFWVCAREQRTGS